MKTLQRTLTIIKPDAVRKNAVGDIIEQFEKHGFRILSMKMLEMASVIGRGTMHSLVIRRVGTVIR